MKRCGGRSDLHRDVPEPNGGVDGKGEAVAGLDDAPTPLGVDYRVGMEGRQIVGALDVSKDALALRPDGFA